MFCITYHLFLQSDVWGCWLDHAINWVVTCWTSVLPTAWGSILCDLLQDGLLKKKWHYCKVFYDTLLISPAINVPLPNLMFIGPCIVVIVEEWKTNLMSLAILFHFLCAQHVSNINISTIRSLRLFCSFCRLNERPTWCHLLFYFTSYVLNMFQTLIYPPSGACDCVVRFVGWMKDQLDVTCYFISLLMCSTCFRH